jgi:hypothetical protein
LVPLAVEADVGDVVFAAPPPLVPLALLAAAVGDEVFPEVELDPDPAAVAEVGAEVFAVPPMDPIGALFTAGVAVTTGAAMGPASTVPCPLGELWIEV